MPHEKKKSPWKRFELERKSRQRLPAHDKRMRRQWLLSFMLAAAKTMEIKAELPCQLETEWNRWICLDQDTAAFCCFREEKPVVCATEDCRPIGTCWVPNGYLSGGRSGCVANATLTVNRSHTVSSFRGYDR